MKKYCVVLGLIILSVYGFSQDWIKTYGGSGIENSTRFWGYHYDYENLICGYTNSFGNGGYDMYVIKTDSNGDTLFTNTTGTSGDEFANSVCDYQPMFKLSGRIVLAGYQMAGTQKNGYLSVFDLGGYPVYSPKTYDFGNGDGEIKDIKSVYYGQVHGVGYKTNTTGNKDMLVLVFNDDMSSLDTAQTYSVFSSGDDVANCMESDGGSQFALGGYVNMGGPNNKDMYLKFFDYYQNMFTPYEFMYGGTGDEEVLSMKFNNYNGAYVLGGYTTSFGANGKDPILVEIDSYGNTIWSNIFNISGDQEINAIDVIGSGDIQSDLNMVIAGYTTQYGDKDVFLARINGVSGDTIWTKVFRNPGIDDIATGIKSDGCIYTITGTTGNDIFTMQYTEKAFDVSYSITDATCPGSENGHIEATISNGQSLNYSFYWMNLINYNSYYDSFVQYATAGPYQVNISDDYGCQLLDTVVVGEPAPISATYTIYKGCMGANDKIVIAHPSGGTPPYTFLWNSQSSDSIVTNTYAGMHFMTIFDSNDCQHIDTVFIQEPQGNFYMSPNYIQSACFGECDGSISLYIMGGTQPYEIIWDNPMFNGLDSIWGLCPGYYDVTVVDAEQCVKTYPSIGVYEQSPTTIYTNNQINASCFNTCDGSLDISAYGNGSFYTYAWSTGETTNYISNLCQGDYYLTTTDEFGCKMQDTITISSPAEIVINSAITGISCFGQYDGAIDLTISGPGSYDFLWSNSAASEDISGLWPGTYSVTVTDPTSGCNNTGSFDIIEPEILSLATTTNAALCNGTSTGAATVIPTGGTTPYSYLWNTGTTTSTTTGLSAGNYYVTVTDSHNCSDTITTTVSEPSQITISTTHSNVLCYGQSNGTITASVTGGTEPYSYLWTNGATTPTINGLPSGGYTVTITDFNSCQNISSIAISQPSPLYTNPITGDTILCQGQQGILATSATGGTSPYNFIWSTGANSSSITIQPTGTTTVYSVYALDANGCNGNPENVIVTLRPELISNLLASDNTICSGQSVQLSVSPTGGNQVYQVYWSNGTSGSTSQIVSPTSTTMYYVTISDNCSPDIVDSVKLVVNGTAAIVGKVKNSTGYIQQNMAEINLYSTTLTEAGGNALIATSNIDANNEFVFLNIPNDSYVIKVKPDTSIQNVFPSYYDSVLTWQEATNISISCDSVYLILTLAEITPITPGTGIISGVITYDIHPGGTKSTLGEPIPGVEITLEQEPDDQPIMSNTSGENGEYSFTDVPSGVYSILVDIPGLPQFETYNFNINQSEQINNMNFIVDTVGSNSAIGVYINGGSGINAVNLSNASISVYPNPASDIINLDIVLKEKNDVEIQIINQSGQKIYSKLSEKIDGNYNIKIDLNSYSNLAAGNYFIITHIGTELYLKKIIITK